MDFTLKVIIPNLDRRPNKWDICYSRLLAAGTPGQNIMRVPSYDGSHYHTITEIKTDAQRHFTKLPNWLAYEKKKRQPTEFAWNWTWYTCLQIISNFPDNHLGLLLIDDVELLVPFTTLESHISQLVLNHSIKMINLNLVVSKNNKLRHRPCIPNTVFQYGLATEYDLANVFTPAGARFYLAFANAHHTAVDPCGLQHILLRRTDIPGIFGLAAPYPDPRGAAYLIRSPSSYVHL